MKNLVETDRKIQIIEKKIGLIQRWWNGGPG